MRADTKTVSIAASPLKIVRFLADPRNLPRWAVGFAQAVRERDGRWIVRTGAGDMEVRIDADESVGTVDFWMFPAPDVTVLAASRVLPRGNESEYTFTQFQPPGMSDDIFARNVSALEHELTVLKAIAEVECPL